MGHSQIMLFQPDRTFTLNLWLNEFLEKCGVGKTLADKNNMI